MGQELNTENAFPSSFKGFSADMAKDIEQNYQELCRSHVEFQFYRGRDDEACYAFHPSHAAHMAKQAVIDAYEPEPSPRRAIIGRLISYAKKIIRRCARPFIKICLNRQQMLNHSVVTLAYATVALEARIQNLERRLHTIDDAKASN